LSTDVLGVPKCEYCSKSIEGCISCEGSQKCTSCKPGLFLTESGLCTTHECDKNSSGECISCHIYDGSKL